MGAGTDDVYAGPGNDTIDGGSHTGLLGDKIHFGTFTDSFGNFTIVTQGVTLDLASTNPQNLGVYGVDTYLNFEDVWGASGNDHFSGTNSGGDDFMMGGPGQDVLIGDAGADYLDVGQSFSAPFGFDGEADVVKYLRITDSTSDNYDEIFNFQNIAAGGIDKIDLSDIDANTSMSGNQAFQFVGTAGFSQPGGEVRLANFDGATLVMVDNDGDSTAEMVFLLHGVTGLVAGDFIL
jgi:serralysin